MSDQIQKAVDAVRHELEAKITELRVQLTDAHVKTSARIQSLEQQINALKKRP